MASGVRTLGALLLGLVTGFWSLVVVFSDFLFLESAYVPAVAATLFVLFDLVAIPAIVLPGGWAGRHLDGPASRPTRGLTRPGADQNL